MVDIQTAAQTASSSASQASSEAEPWASLASQLDDLVCGPDELEAASEVAFEETMPTVCWAIPGAYAGSVDC